MHVRASANSDFDVTTCEYAIHAKVKSVSINGQKLQLLKHAPTRIIIIGDSGCRTRKHRKLKKTVYQACNNPAKWPFAKISSVAAKLKPDLIIHTGDYYYRESPCPAGNKGCEGTPYGDNWPAWQADFFKPAKPLLASAPWIMGRGDRELCHNANPAKRGDKGFMRFISAFPDVACIRFQPMYAIPFDGLTFAVIDTSESERYPVGKMPTNPVLQYKKMLKQISELSAKNVWLISQVPLWTVAPNKPGQITTPITVASNLNLSPNINLVISGDIHNLHLLSFKSNRAAQMIVGNSGSKLQTRPAYLVPGLSEADVKMWYKMKKFGFVFMIKQRRGWEIQVRNVQGKIMQKMYV